MKTTHKLNETFPVRFKLNIVNVIDVTGVRWSIFERTWNTLCARIRNEQIKPFLDNSNTIFDLINVAGPEKTIRSSKLTGFFRATIVGKVTNFPRNKSNYVS